MSTQNMRVPLYEVFHAMTYLFEVKSRDSIVLLLSISGILKGPPIVASRQSFKHWNIYWAFLRRGAGMMGKGISA